MRGKDVGAMDTQEIIVTAVLPWFSTDAMPEVRLTSGDDQKLIDMCLSCQHPCCCNCIDSHSSGAGRGRKEKEINIETLREMMRLHRKIPEICAALNVSERTLFRYKKKLKAAGVTI